ncbi:MAG: glutamate synthase large subunit [Chloroflexota bacterium]|nr:glutamate synthase large subunit [Chloroflexota bacterium]
MAGSDHAYPLYDPRFEHDACGVGFVAATDQRDRHRVLSLALAGLANLAHRGAFAADGESSDGAGVSLPLEPPLLKRIAPGTRGRVAVAMLFLPAEPSANRAARRMVEGSLAAEGLAVAAWRDVPVDAEQVGREARGSIPAVAQAVVSWSSGGSTRRSRIVLERRLLLARRRMELTAGHAGLSDFAVVSASTRTIVYKGLVAGSRLAAFYPDLSPDGLPLSHAVFHQRYATNTSPSWTLAQPFRLIAHNGEINTVRANREEVRGRRARLGGRLGRRLASLDSLLDENGSDSLSLDEAIDLLTAAGWRLDAALLLAIPEAADLRAETYPELEAFRRRTAGLLAPWDGPAAICFSDGRRVGTMLDRNGLRPAAVTVTHSGLVAVASEAGAVPIGAAETADRRRLGPGEMLVVDTVERTILHDTEAKVAATRSLGRPLPPARDRRAQPTYHSAPARSRTPHLDRWLFGLDAERLRLDVRTMAIEGQEPLWSMGDDTPTPALGRLDRPVADHLRQSFAQVTNPAIDPERERIVMDLSVELGRRPPLLARLSGRRRTVRLTSPFVADLEGPTSHRSRTLDATWDGGAGPAGLSRALDGLCRRAVSAARSGRIELLVISDRAAGGNRLPIPSALAVGAVHTALTNAGLRGESAHQADAGDVLDVHSAAMALACGARAVRPWLALELAAQLAGERGAEQLTADEAVSNLLRALDKGVRKVLARMGISAVASYVGGQLFDVLEVSPEVIARCFPQAPAWPGPVGFEQIAARQLRRLAATADLGVGDRLPDPGFVRFRADGELHLFARPVVKAVQGLAGFDAGAPIPSDDAVTAYRLALARPPAVIRDQLALRQTARPVPLDEVEPAEAIMRRFVGAAMSLGALSPEAHQALTIGLRRIGAASNTGEGGEDPAWYAEIDGMRRDAAIKQVASARFGVTATYLARAEQLEIKIAQGSKPGEGGQLPAKKVTPLIAALRRAQPGQSLISPPPHHDIYSIEDLAQLIADLRAINGGARIGVKLVAALGVGTVAAGVAKAGADYVQISGHSGGTGASPLSSIKHAGIPWELGLAEVHQVLMRNGLRDRVALRTDGGLQSGRDVVVAALLGAEEYGFGTAALVALGCDMARQCHLDTCPTGIATHRDDLRAKFSGTPEHVERFFRGIAQDVRRELAALGCRSLAEAIGQSSGMLNPAPAQHRTVDLKRLISAPAWPASPARRADPVSARFTVAREPASATEAALAARYTHLPHIVPDPVIHTLEHADSPIEGEPTAAVPITTADRSFGAHISGLAEVGVIRRPVRWRLEGSAGQSFGCFAGPLVELELVGQANDYVGKGLSGGVVVVRPEDELLERASELAIAGNTCLYGATGGRLHVVGRAGMRFAVRNSGAQAVVEGLGAHGCEYMTGGIVVILGPTGRNLCAGMSGGRVYLWDPEGVHVGGLDRASARAIRLSAAMLEHPDGADRVDELRGLLEDHRAAGSLLARRLLQRKARLGDEFWLVEPAATPIAAPSAPVPAPRADSAMPTDAAGTTAR